MKLICAIDYTNVNINFQFTKKNNVKKHKAQKKYVFFVLITNIIIILIVFSQ